MWVLFLLLMIAFAALILKHMALQVRHQNKQREYLILVKEYNGVVNLANKMDIQLGALHEKNRQLLLRDTGADMDQGLVKELIAFCHPDKHGGSDQGESIDSEAIEDTQMIGEPVTPPEFWEIVGIDNITKFFSDKKINYLIYRMGEACASTMEFDQRPVVKVEVDVVGRPRIIQYFNSYETLMSRYPNWSAYDK